MMEQNALLTNRIQEVIDEERQQAAEDRRNLLVQIGALIEAQAETQESRLAEKAELLKKGLLDANSTLGGSVDRYGESMDTWDEKEGQLLEDIRSSRDSLKTRLKDDWNVSEDFIRVCSDPSSGRMVKLMTDTVTRSPMSTAPLSRLRQSRSMRRRFASSMLKSPISGSRCKHSTTSLTAPEARTPSTMTRKPRLCKASRQRSSNHTRASEHTSKPISSA